MEVQQFITHTLEEIEQLILEHGGKCVNCGAKLRKGSIRSYDHLGGIRVQGKEAPQWVYFHCSKCKLDSALWKVLDQINAEEVSKQ